MTPEERAETVQRLERLAKLHHDQDVTIHTTDALPGVLFGYAFNISKCQGFRRCVEACINENNLDREADTQYIRIFERESGVLDLNKADATFQHDVPVEGYSYIGTQCFQCANPPCVPVCPVGATWQEPDGTVLVRVALPIELGEARSPYVEDARVTTIVRLPGRPRPSRRSCRVICLIDSGA